MAAGRRRSRPNGRGCQWHCRHGSSAAAGAAEWQIDPDTAPALSDTSARSQAEPKAGKEQQAEWQIKADTELVLSETAVDAAADNRAANEAAAEVPEWRADPDTDLVLSDVHIGRAPSAAQRCTTVFRFRRAWRDRTSGGGGGSVSSGSSPGGANGDGHARTQPARTEPASSAAAAAEVDADGDVIVMRRRIVAAEGAVSIESGAGGVADGIVARHAMATSLNEVGRQASGEGSCRCGRWQVSGGIRSWTIMLCCR